MRWGALPPAIRSPRFFWIYDKGQTANGRPRPHPLAHAWTFAPAGRMAKKRPRMGYGAPFGRGICAPFPLFPVSPPPTGRLKAAGEKATASGRSPT